MATSLRGLGLNLRDAVREIIRRVRRTQPGPALLRLVAGLGAAGALAVGAPHSVVASPQAGLLVPFAAGVMLFPRTRWVGITAALAIGLWLLDSITFHGEPPLWRTGLLAAGLYLMHSAAAHAAVLPYDASVSREVLLRLGVRVGGVIVVSVGVALAGMAVIGRLPVQHSIIGPIAGSAVAAVLVGVLAGQLRRRS